METYEPLKSPEMQRDDATGRFERKGMLGKAAKFRPDQQNFGIKRGGLKRRPRGKPFQPGVSGNPAGKPRGTLNRVTRDLKLAVLLAGERAGGEEGLIGYLTRLAVENSSAYASLLGKCLPHTLTADESSGGVGMHIHFTREIVWPDGRREVEGATPKSLPAPDASRDRGHDAKNAAGA